MNASLWVRFLAAVLCFAAWGALVLMGKAPASEFVFALGQALVGLGVYHASTNGAAGNIEGVAIPLAPAEPVIAAPALVPAVAASTTAAPPVATPPAQAVVAAASTLQ